MRPALLLLIATLLPAQEARLNALLKDILIFDAHIDTPRYFLDEGYKLNERHTYYELDLPRLKREMAQPVIVDLRNIYRREDMTAHGFVYESVGRGVT